MLCTKVSKNSPSRSFSFVLLSGTDIHFLFQTALLKDNLALNFDGHRLEARIAKLGPMS